MKRLFLVLVALVIATAPAVADICRADCERARQPECPLHQQTPHKCAHDHSTAQGTISNANAGGAPTVLLAIPTAAAPLAGAFVSTILTVTTSQHAPRLRSPHIVVLRI